MDMQPRTARVGATLLAISAALAAGVVAEENPQPAPLVLTGQVVAAANGAAIAGAAITEQPQGLRATSDVSGRFRLSGLRPGKHTLSVAAARYALRQLAVEVVAGKANDIKVALQPVVVAAQPEAAVRFGPIKKAGSASGRLSGLGSIDTGGGTGRNASIVRAERARRPSPAVAMGHGGLAIRGSGSGGGGFAVGAFHASSQGHAMAAELRDDGASREGYDRVDEQSFASVADKPLSTLSIDVDSAAYSNVRRFVERGQLPPQDAVRIEELINYFPYAYPDPEGDLPFAVHTEVSSAPWYPGHRLARIGIQGRRIDARNLPPANLVFLIDVSGSMNSHDKLPLVQRSLAMLTEELRPQDRVAVVVYAGAAGLVLPPTSGADKEVILRAIGQLQAGGSTAGGEGIALAYAVAQRSFVRHGLNRVILATDGDFNVGISSDGELLRLIEDKRKSGVFLTVLGYGTGNYQDAKMQKLADAGNGHHAYIDSLFEAHKVLVAEMGATLLTLAKDVKIQVEFNPAFVKGYRLIGYENRLLAARDFNDDKKDAGELGAGHAVTALYEIVPAGSAEPLQGTDRLKYQQSRLAPAAARSGELMTVKLRYKAPHGDTSRLIERPVRDESLALGATSPDFRFAAAVAGYGLVLRASPFRGAASHAAALELARGALGADPGGHRREFLRLIEKTMELVRNP